MSERTGSPAKHYVWWPTFTVGLVLLAFGVAMTRGSAPLVGLVVAVLGIAMGGYALLRRGQEQGAR
jgi:hypothetical protein